MTGVRECSNTTQPRLSTRPEVWEHCVLGVRWAYPVPTTSVTRASGERQLVGRASDCDVVLSGPEISRHHAEMFRRGPLWVIRDLGSRNSIHINGHRIEQESLSPGDVLRIGEWIGVVRQVSLPFADDEVPFGELSRGVFGSTILARVLRHAQAAARSDLRIVIQGETGTGKECVAQAVHEWSGRVGNFVAVNCAALPESLAESELFGYRKGAFTGADRASLGHLRSANGGTLLLDEITDLPLAVQAKLLRALEQRAVVPLGESMPLPIDVRIIAATQESLRAAVEQDRFRKDLWARLDGVTISLPPLRDRNEDAPGLFLKLLQQGGEQSRAVDARLLEQLCLYDWPGNVRELAQLARQMAVLRQEEKELRRSHLPDRILCRKLECCSDIPAAPPVAEHRALGLARSVDETELRREEDRHALLQALRLHGGNVALAARELGISRQKAYRRLEALPDEVLEEFRKTRGRRARE
ncbi:MAG TPA: sigma 54-interacting transcriptional regulator [Polyangiaceae bacterium]|nr:sigma 54-interacting transcriptional regulator [Polyangiaceae bacterium]